MLAIVIFVILPAALALPAHFGRDSRPVRYMLARDSAGRAIAIMGEDPHTGRSSIVRVLP